MSNLDHAKLRDLFDRAMQLAPSERASFLDSECRGDAALRARADELVKAAETDGTFLSSPTGDMGTQTRRQLAATVTLVEGPGTKIGLYKLLQLIGEGGFGSVFLAEQEKPVRRRVALKIIKLGMDTRSIIARFEAERQALALMDHPHIARVLDAGATDSGRPFFVMEYVVGDAITKFSDAHKLNVRERLDLFAQVCQAVQHAHTKGIIHRDLKPGNILVSMSDGKPFAKVIDFGIAKATAQPLTDKTLFTEHRQLIGTPEYMSPEQAEGSPDIDTRTDVYALGVLLYELLTGATPFDAKRLRSAAYAEMQRIIKEEEPLAPSVRLQRELTTLAETASARQSEPAKLNSLVKGELDWIVMKALDKERGRRYESASSLAADVQRHLAGEAVVAAPASVGYRVRKFVRRHKGAVFAGSAVAAALLVGSVGTTWQWFETRNREKRIGSYEQRVRDGLQTIENIRQAHAKPEMMTLGREQGLMSGGRINIDKSGQVTLVDAPGKPGSGLEAGVSNLAWQAGISMIQLSEQLNAAEWNAYTANIALAQASMQANNWPEARQRLEDCPPSKRGWEWELLRRASNAVTYAIGQSWFAPQFSPDGRRVAVIDNEDDYSSIVLLDSSTLKQLGRRELSVYARALEFSSDGERILISCHRARPLIWNLETDSLTAIGGPAINESHSAVFSPDNSLIAISGYNTPVSIWSVPSLSELATLPTTDNSCVLFVPRTDAVVTGGTDQPLKLWRANDWSNPRVVGGASWTLAVNPSDGTLASLPLDRGVAVFAGPQLKPKPFASHRWIQPDALSWSGDGQRLAVSSRLGGRVLVLDGNTGNILHVAQFSPLFDEFAPFELGPIAMSPNGTRGITSRGSHLVAFDIPQCESVSDYLPPPEAKLAIGEVMASGGSSAVGSSRFSARIGDDGGLSISEVSETSKAGLTSASVNISVQGARAAIFTDDSKRLIVACADSSIRFYETKNWRELAVIRVPQVVTKLQMTSDGTRLILSHADGSARIWDIREPVERLKDRQREWDEQPAADSYVEALLAGPRATGELDAFLRADESLTPLRRLVAWRTLRDRLADLDRDASDRYEAAKKQASEREIKDKVAFTQLLEAELALVKDLSPRVAEKVRGLGEKWEHLEAKKQFTDAERAAQVMLIETLVAQYRQRTESDSSLQSGVRGDGAAEVVANARLLFGPDDSRTLMALMERALGTDDDAQALALIAEEQRRRGDPPPVDAMTVALLRQSSRLRWNLGDVQAAITDLDRAYLLVTQLARSQPSVAVSVSVLFNETRIGMLTVDGTATELIADSMFTGYLCERFALLQSIACKAAASGDTKSFSSAMSAVTAPLALLESQAFELPDSTPSFHLRKAILQVTVAGASSTIRDAAAARASDYFSGTDYLFLARQSLSKARAMLAAPVLGSVDWSKDERIQRLLSQAIDLIDGGSTSSP